MSKKSGFLVPERELKILGFDLECRPLSWYGGDWVTKEITAIAWRFTDGKQTQCALLNDVEHWRVELTKVLTRFRKAYDQADIVTGHFIRGFDLPIINGAFMELDLEPLGPKMSSDTKNDLIRVSGLSKSQENLGAMFGLSNQKVGMNQAMWREANRLTAEGKKLVRERVCGDVEQQLEMREYMLTRGWLKPPSVWSPGAAKAERYHA